MLLCTSSRQWCSVRRVDRVEAEGQQPAEEAPEDRRQEGEAQTHRDGHYTSTHSTHYPRSVPLCILTRFLPIRLCEQRAKELYKQQKREAKASNASALSPPPSDSISASPSPSPLPPSPRHLEPSQPLSSPSPATPRSASPSPGLSRTEQLTLLRSQVKSELVKAEFHVRKKKLEKVDNAIRNATKSGPKVKGYSYTDEADKLRRDIEASLTAKVKLKKEAKLTEPHTPISHLLHRASEGRRSLLAWLLDEGGLERLRGLTPKEVGSSVLCYRDIVRSPLNYKVELMWRVAVVGEEWAEGWEGVDVMWRVAYELYGKLMELCDPARSPWQYAALRAGLQRTVEKLEEWDVRKRLEGSNRPIVFVPPNFEDGQAMFFFQS